MALTRYDRDNPACRAVAQDPQVDAVRLGLSIRALRRRRGWTQRDLGRRIGISDSEISRIERGAAHRVPMGLVESIVNALGARLQVRMLWQGEELDRLLDRDHARMVEATVQLLARRGWTAVPEATFQIRGERGAVDILAWHPATRTVVVIEAKSVVPDVQATLSGIDRKSRLAPTLAKDRGWDVACMATFLVLPDDRTARRRLAAFSGTFDRVLPARTTEIKGWLASPSGSLAGVLFLSNLPRTQARQRIRPSPRRATLGTASPS